ncbi:hypothetical protein JMG10_32480 [Nostoc ellipsosporum NOK]|nr:hypothetical protein [Nostoc ellipsosporum NOK]
MKKFFFSCALVLAGLFVQAQNKQIGVGYNLFLPGGEMKKGFKSEHGLNLEVLFPIKKLPFMRLGADLQIGTYGSTTRRQTFTFRDGSSTEADVNLNSNIATGGVRVRFERPRTDNSKRLAAYAQIMAGGLSMYSTLEVEDPHDTDGCRPLDRRTTVKDYTWYAGGGAGLIYETSKRTALNRSFIDLGFSCIGGGKQEYANMGKVYETNVTNPSEGKPLNVRFVNVSTNEEHEHRVADIYEHPVKLVQVQVRFVYRW